MEWLNCTFPGNSSDSLSSSSYTAQSTRKCTGCRMFMFQNRGLCSLLVIDTLMLFPRPLCWVECRSRQKGFIRYLLGLLNLNESINTHTRKHTHTHTLIQTLVSFIWVHQWNAQEHKQWRNRRQRTERTVSSRRSAAALSLPPKSTVLHQRRKQ